LIFIPLSTPIAFAECVFYYNRVIAVVQRTGYCEHIWNK